MTSTKAGLTSSLRHRDFRLLMSAFAASAVGSWASNVALAVWIFEETGSAGWVGAATIGRFVPALLFSAYGGVLADRFERVRLMVIIDVAAGLVMLLLAAETLVGAPVLLAIATAAVTSTLATAYEPAVAAMTPQLVGERDLGSANALRNTIDNLCVVAGPGLGAVMLFLGPPSLAICLNAVSFFVSAVTVGRVRARSTPVDVTEGGQRGALRQMIVGARAITSSPSAAVLVAYSVFATFVFGIDTVLLVVVSRDVLGMGAEGFGYLLAGLGVGGILAAGPVARLARRPRLGLVILGGMAAYCLPTLVFLFASSPVLAIGLQVVRGAGTLVVDVLAVTALQRSLPRELLARVFGAFNAVMLAAVLLGGLVAPLLIDGVSLDAALWFSGLAIPAACWLGWPVLRRMDREAAARRAARAPKVELISKCDLFADVAAGALDQLADAATLVKVEVGELVVREGDPADRFYVVDTGEFDVASRSEGGQPVQLGRLSAGDYFGEIGLIEQIPRTATVTAITHGSLLSIDGSTLLQALTESSPSPAFLDGASLRLRRTHPSQELTRKGLEASDGSAA